LVIRNSDNKLITPNFTDIHVLRATRDMYLFTYLTNKHIPWTTMHHHHPSRHPGHPGELLVSCWAAGIPVTGILVKAPVKVFPVPGEMASVVPALVAVGVTKTYLTSMRKPCVPHIYAFVKSKWVRNS
jgi:hypothetical protein